jgi:N-ethylmaleimide reductase
VHNARRYFKNIITIAGGFTVQTAEEILQAQHVDFVAFAKLYIFNPDLVERTEHNAPWPNGTKILFIMVAKRGM